MGERNATFGESQLERPNWFPGRVVTAAGLDEQQAFFRERMRRRNRLLHGWGVVSGFDVSVGVGLTLDVGPGFALDAAGNEIVLAEGHVVDVRAAGLTTPHEPYWLVVRWDERPSGELPAAQPDIPPVTAAWQEDAELALLGDEPDEEPDDAVHAAAPWVELARITWDGDTGLNVDPGVRRALAVGQPR